MILNFWYSISQMILNTLALSGLTSPSAKLYDHKLEMRISNYSSLNKGNGLAISEADDYFLRLEKIIEDGSKFIEVKLQHSKRKFDSILRQKMFKGWWLRCP